MTAARGEGRTGFAGDAQPLTYGIVEHGETLVLMCPVCGVVFSATASFSGYLRIRECVAQSQEYERMNGEPIYLFACDQHSLEDVHAMIHGRTISSGPGGARGRGRDDDRHHHLRRGQGAGHAAGD